MGRSRVLDFGLAKAMDPAAASRIEAPFWGHAWAVLPDGKRLLFVESPSA